MPIGAGVDANAIDPATQLAFASCREVTVTIAHEATTEKLTVADTPKTERGARTMALDSKTHRNYLATVKYKPQPAGSKERPKAIVGTFKIAFSVMDKSEGRWRDDREHATEPRQNHVRPLSIVI